MTQSDDRRGDTQTYSPELCHQLEQMAVDPGLLRHYHPKRYDAGKHISYDITGVYPEFTARAGFEILKFVGGGFAGQVYRVRLVSLESDDDAAGMLRIGGEYAIKILIPPSGFSKKFRNFIFWLAYQGPFSAQVNPSAARAGVMWQKLIRRGARVSLGSENAVVDTYATFYDDQFDSYGEINEWVSGRTWKYEIDDHLFRRGKRYKGYIAGQTTPAASMEYLTKKKFMKDVVQLLHDMGAPELARQYEWGTMKSQPNALLRVDGGEAKADNLCCIDFRAGLALLPYLPMSPADVKLIARGLLRGDLVQFDRGNFKKLNAFIESHRSEFEDMLPLVELLRAEDGKYRRSLPDVSHQGLRLIGSASLRADVRKGLIRGWQCAGLLDDENASKVERSVLRFIPYYFAGAIPFMGKFIRRITGNRNYAAHVGKALLSRSYFKRMLKSKQTVALADWHRDGRCSEDRTRSLLKKPGRFWLQKIFLSWLPPKWHRFLTEADYAWDSLKYTLTYPVRFYRDADFREHWLIEQVETGEQEGMISPDEAAYIKARIKDPFIQKYLKCVAVHIATLPITQVISLVAAIYAMIRFGNTWAEGLAYAGVVLAAFQATPISPGSLVRGIYVVYLIIRERNLRNYWIAAIISFWHYIGYLGFPIQMVAKFPALSRLMAGRWATNIVHIIPVFGERGALLEHWIFDLFFNLPVSVRSLFRKS